uniref:MACPF domain-containing protein n=1 Tax=Graphocephala atropunctata TaxID=36148 RepID=A0A1B6KYL9_9HEMI
MLRWVLYSVLLVSVLADIHVGGALNIFSYFGNLGSVVKVNPHHGASWFYDHDTVDVFEEVLETRSSPQPLENPKFNGDFHVQLCDNMDQLQQAFFRLYHIEGVEKPWRAFTRGLTPTVLARRLGLNSTFVTGEHGYALVRLSRIHELVRLTPHTGLRLNNWTAERTRRLVAGQVESVLSFIRRSGSHYVSAYTTGDSLFQVYVFTPVMYQELKREMSEFEASKVRLDQVLRFFSPWHAEHLGSIKTSSGNNSLEQWASVHLRSQLYMFLYPNLLTLHNHPELLQELNYLLGNNALLSVNLRTLAHIIKDVGKRLWFQEVLDNHLRLWELNV